MLFSSFRPEDLLERTWHSRDQHQFIRENLMRVQMNLQHRVLLHHLVNEHRISRATLTFLFASVDQDYLCEMS